MLPSPTVAIVVAAGSGSRMQSELPKQFLSLGGQEVLRYSVETFLRHPQIDEVIIVTAGAYLERVSRDYPACRVVIGGAQRQDSVFQGLQACSANTRLVLVHDAARPLVPPGLIDVCINTLKTFDGLAPVLTPTDSMIELDAGAFRNLDRSRLRLVQTPQCFHFDLLWRAHQSGLRDTDELGLVRQAIPGARLTFIEGASEAFKITTALDLIVAEHLLGKS